MDARLQTLLDLPPRSVEEVLEELSGLRERQRADPSLQVPRVTLLLHGGNRVEGYVLKVGASKSGGRQVLLHDPGPDFRSPDFNVVYVALASVEGLTFHDIPAFAPKPAPPTRLQLTRRLAAAQEAIAKQVGATITFEVDWTQVPEGDGPLRTLASLIDETEAAVLAVAADQMGREAVKAKLRGVTFLVSATASASWEGEVFRVAAPPDSSHWERVALRHELEQGL